MITTETGLQLNAIDVNAEYRKQWNAYMHDFLHLTKNGELISNTLYRIGGLGTPNLKTDRYFMLIKYVEAYYSDDITEDENKKPHLEGRWCILDSTGKERVEFPSYTHPYLVKDSCIYSVNQNYYNIETGEFYCSARTSMNTSQFLFLENSWDKDLSKRGVMKIDKNIGTWELFPDNL